MKGQNDSNLGPLGPYTIPGQLEPYQMYGDNWPGMVYGPNGPGMESFWPFIF